LSIYVFFPLGHTNLIVWIAGEQAIFFSSVEGKKIKIKTPTSGISEQEENSMIFPRLPLL
jgi:hypothetical protein